MEVVPVKKSRAVDCHQPNRDGHGVVGPLPLRLQHSHDRDHCAEDVHGVRTGRYLLQNLNEPDRQFSLTGDPLGELLQLLLRRKAGVKQQKEYLFKTRVLGQVVDAVASVVKSCAQVDSANGGFKAFGVFGGSGFVSLHSIR